MKSGIQLLFLTLFSFVAASQTCADSSFRVRYYSTSNFSIREHINTSNNGSILIGSIYGSLTTPASGLVMKVDDGGEVQWSKKIAMGSTMTLKKVIELSGGGFIIAGEFITKTSQETNIILLKLTSGGTVAWSKAYSLNNAFLKTDGKQFYIITEGQNGDILTAWRGVHTELNQNSDSSYAVISRLNAAGNLIWSKAFVSKDGVFTDPAGLFVQNNSVLSLGRVSDLAINCANSLNVFYGMKLDYTTGALLQLKPYCYSDAGTNIAFYNTYHHSFYATRLSSDRFALYGNLFDQIPQQNSYYYKVIFDEQFNLVKSRMYSVSRTVGVNHRRTYLSPNGDLHINLSSFPAQKIYWATLDSNDQAKRQKRMSFPVNGSIAGAASGSFGFKPKNSATYALSYSLPGQSFVQFFQVQPNDKGNDLCLGQDTAFVNVEPFDAIAATDWLWKNIIDNPVVSLPQAVSVTDAAIQKEDICKQISRCESLRISGPDTVCVIGEETIYTVLKNPECRKRITWQSDPDAIASITPVNDFTVRIRFQMPGRGALQTKLYAAAGDCDVAKDTLTVTLLPVAKPLPEDTMLCAGQTLRLTPSHWFKSYLWQNGSTDSVFTATHLGKYYVRATAHCGYVLSDTIHLTSPKFTLGQSKTICIGDTAQLQAPAGFSNYSWLPKINLVPVSDSAAKVFPLINTAYTVTAKTTAGCIVKDTVSITLLPAPVVSLGRDTAVCEGTSIKLHAIRLLQNMNGIPAPHQRQLQ